MRPFSDEAERSAQVATELEPFFNVAEALHNSWLTHAKDEWLRKSKLQRQALNVAVMLDVQASRLFRSVIEECRRCEAYGANIISRSLFETVLAIPSTTPQELRPPVLLWVASPRRPGTSW